ncbi:MAG: hypothetical protein N4A50_09695 [Vallitalea sp.]|nr:hypothetical protein [Vallitalea sp.]
MKYLSKLIITIIIVSFICSCSNKNNYSTYNKDNGIEHRIRSDLNNSNNQQKNNSDDSSKSIIDSLYDYGNIYSYHELSNNEINFIELSSFLQPKGVEFHSSKYDEKTHVLKICYNLNLTERGQVYNFDFEKEVKDSMLLLAILDFVEGIEFEYIQVGFYSAESIYNRNDIQRISGIDICEYGKTKEKFTQELALLINKLEYKPDIMPFVDYEHVMGLDE